MSFLLSDNYLSSLDNSSSFFLSCMPSLLRFRLARYCYGVNLSQLTERITDQLPKLCEKKQSFLVSRFNYLLEKEWQVKNRVIFQNLIQNTLDNQKLFFLNFPLELLNHLMSFLSITDLVRLRVCKKLVFSVLQHSLIYEFCVKKLLSHPAQPLDNFFCYLEHKGEKIKNLELTHPKLALTDIQLLYILKTCPHLTYLKIKNQKNICNFESLVALTQLKGLDLIRCCQVSDEALFSFTQLHKLNSFHLENCCKITAKGFESLKKMTQLQHLHLTWVFLTDDTLRQLNCFKSLKTLNLKGNSSITDEGLSSFTSLSQLEKINLSHCLAITEKALVYLSLLPNLKVVILSFHNSLTYNLSRNLHSYKHLSIQWSNE